MTSKTSICNKALIRLGENLLTNVDTDDTQVSNKIKAVYDDLLEEVLRQHDWNFAIVRQSLARNSAEPLYEYKYSYALPTTPKYIKLVDIQNKPQYKIEGNKILTDATILNIRYVSLVTDPNQYDSLFINAFALRIAFEICTAVTGDSRTGGLTRTLQEEYIAAISRAKDFDFQEENEYPLFESEFVNTRFLDTAPFNINIDNA